MRYKIKINDDERQLIVKALYDWRNQPPTDSLLRPDLEQLKAEDQLTWAQRMNAIRACAERIVTSDLIND